MKNNVFLLLSVIAVLVISSCKKDVDNPSHPSNEGEVITTLRLTFVDSANTSDVRVAEFRDPDGPGGIAYDRFDTIRLARNSTYYTQVLLLNETVTPADTISNEVLQESDEHLLCYTPVGISATVVVTDIDSNNLPIGLRSSWYTTGAGNGTMLVVLKHQPGTKNGNCSTGETDVEVGFPVAVN